MCMCSAWHHIHCAGDAKSNLQDGRLNPVGPWHGAGPDFAHAPPELKGVPAARPVADLAALDDLAPVPNASPLVQQPVKREEDSTVRQEQGGGESQPDGSGAAIMAAPAVAPDPAG